MSAAGSGVNVPGTLGPMVGSGGPVGVGVGVGVGVEVGVAVAEGVGVAVADGASSAPARSPALPGWHAATAVSTATSVAVRHQDTWVVVRITRAMLRAPARSGVQALGTRRQGPPYRTIGPARAGYTIGRRPHRVIRAIVRQLIGCCAGGAVRHPSIHPANHARRTRGSRHDRTRWTSVQEPT